MIRLFKRRHLRPYVNPLLILKKYEETQLDNNSKLKYKFTIKTGSGQYAGTNSNVEN